MSDNFTNKRDSEFSTVPENAPIFQLTYVSTQTRDMNAADLIGMLNQAQIANDQLGITGLLLHREDSFFQIIEGNQDSVENLFKKIESDSRHTRVEVMFRGDAKGREFPDWKMGFLELDGIDVRMLPAFSKFLEDDAEPRQFLKALSRGKRLALLFRSVL